MQEKIFNSMKEKQCSCSLLSLIKFKEHDEKTENDQYQYLIITLCSIAKIGFTTSDIYAKKERIINTSIRAIASNKETSNSLFLRIEYKREH